MNLIERIKTVVCVLVSISICLLTNVLAHSFPTVGQLPVQGAQKSFKSIERPSRILFILPCYVWGGIGTAFCAMLENFPREDVIIDVYVLNKLKGTFFDPSLIRKNTKFVEKSEALIHRYDSVISYAQWIDPNDWGGVFHGRKKVQWIHCDPSQQKACMLTLKQQLSRVAARQQSIDAFICVSQVAKENFILCFPEEATKVYALYNVVDNEKIRRLSQESQTEIEEETGSLNVVSVGRLSPEKGFDTAVKVHAQLEQEGIHLKWYVVGEGPQRKKLETLIRSFGLQDKFILLGHKDNPYPYIKKADIFTHFSRTEGFGLVVTEAKILCRPILITDFSTSSEQIESGKNGLIVQNVLEPICTAMKQLVQNKSMRDRFSGELRGYRFDNEIAMNKLCSLLLE